MNKNYPYLFHPIRLGNVQLKNRIACPPSSLQVLGEHDYVRPQDAAFWELKAEGGCGLVTIGESIIHTPTGKSHKQQIPLDDPNAVPGLAQVAWGIRRHGAVASIELSHGGKFANIDNFSMGSTGLPAYGPMEEHLSNGTIVHQMDDDMIYMLIDAYGKAAKRAKDAGFNMINIHAGHGWLINQFMSEITNQRDDKWGGSFEKRMRFADLVLDSIRSMVGPGFPIEFRISGKEYMPGGYEIEEAIKIARHFENKVQLINVSAGNHEYMEAMLVMHPDMFKKDGYFADLAAAVKKEISTPVAAVGGLLDADMMEEMIATGKADIVEIGRGMLADPFMANKYRDGKADEVVKCLRCFACVGETILEHRTIRCALNPLIGRELESKYTRTKADKKKKALIAGAGPAGLMAAVTAARRGHNVIVCEKTDAVGGLLRSERKVLFKQRIYEYPKTLETQAKNLGVEFRFRTKVTKELINEIKPDAVICAIGAEVITPKIPGIRNQNVFHVTELPDNEDKLGEKVVVIGGGLAGAEAAIDLSWKGKQVVILEMASDIAIDCNPFHKSAIGFQIRDEKINVYTGITAKEINQKGVIGTDKDGKESLFEADTVIYAVGMKAKWDEVDELRGCNVTEFHQVGDCFRPAKIKDATTVAFQVAVDL